MGQILSEMQRERLDELVAEAERRTKAQIVLAVIKRSDSYDELPWKAMAMGVSIAGLLVFVLGLLRGFSNSNATVLVAVAATLGTGCALALMAIFVNAFARLFLSGHRAETEVLQYARSVFLTREIFATGGRTGILLLVSLFERQVVILPDSGLRGRLTGDAMRDIIARMTAILAAGDTVRALEEGLEGLSAALEATAPGTPAGAGENELSDEIIEEKGA